MSTDLQERFARAWEDEPAPLPLERLLAGGRSARRRRRLAVTAWTAAVLMVLGGMTVAVTSLPPGSDGLVATDYPPLDPDVPSGAEGFEVARTPEERAVIGADHNAGRTHDGRIVISPGWVVTQKYDGDELTLGGDRVDGVGFELRNTTTDEGEWYLLAWDADGVTSMMRSWPAANLGMTLAEWLTRNPR